MRFAASIRCLARQGAVRTLAGGRGEPLLAVFCGLPSLWRETDSVIEKNAEELAGHGPIHATREMVALGSKAKREITAVFCGFAALCRETDILAEKPPTSISRLRRDRCPCGCKSAMIPMGTNFHADFRGVEILNGMEKLKSER